MLSQHPVVTPVAHAYDAAAECYDAWHWSRFWQEREVPIVSRLLATSERGLVVDAGCGTGRYRVVARRLGFRYLGIDVSTGMLAVGAASLGDSTEGDALLAADLRATGLSPRIAAVALCARTLCHVPDVEAALTEFARITRDGGALIVTDLKPAFHVPLTRLPTPGGKIDVATFRRSPDDLVTAASAAGFHLTERIDVGEERDGFYVLRMIRN